MTYQIGLNAEHRVSLRWQGSAMVQIAAFAVLVALQGSLLAVAAQSQPQAPATSPQRGARQTINKKFTLRITREGIIGVSLKADKVKVSEVAADLAKRLSTLVKLGPAMEKEAITVEFSDLPLETAMSLLAPRVFIDYEIRKDALPTPMAIYLLGNTDPEPALNSVVQGDSQAMLIEGNTEDPAGVSSYVPEDDPLQVDLDDNSLTIKSKKQPLAVVIMTVAEVLEIPAEIKYESTEIVDTVIKDTPLEDAIPRLSPNVRLYVRVDLHKSVRTPLRLKLVPPAARAAGQ